MTRVFVIQAVSRKCHDHKRPSEWSFKRRITRRLAGLKRECVKYTWGADSTGEVQLFE